MDYVITAGGVLGVALAVVFVIAALVLFVRGCNKLGDVLLKAVGRG